MPCPTGHVHSIDYGFCRKLSSDGFIWIIVNKQLTFVHINVPKCSVVGAFLLLPKKVRNEVFLSCTFKSFGFGNPVNHFDKWINSHVFANIYLFSKRYKLGLSKLVSFLHTKVWIYVLDWYKKLFLSRIKVQHTVQMHFYSSEITYLIFYLFLRVHNSL